MGGIGLDLNMDIALARTEAVLTFHNAVSLESNCSPWHLSLSDLPTRPSVILDPLRTILIGIVKADRKDSKQPDGRLGGKFLQRESSRLVRLR